MKCGTLQSSSCFAAYMGPAWFLQSQARCMSKALWGIMFARVQDHVPHGRHGEQDAALCLPKLWLPAASWQELPLCQQDQITVNKLTQNIKHISRDLILSTTGTAVIRRQDIMKTFSSSPFAQHLRTPLRLYNVHSATNAPHCSHHWMIRGGVWVPDTFSQPRPLDLHGWFSPCGTASANSVPYLLPKHTEDLFSK